MLPWITSLLNTPEAQLEETESPLKVYQQLCLGNVCMGGEWLKSKAVKRNLTANMKKVEDTLTKQNQDFKQPQNNIYIYSKRTPEGKGRGFQGEEAET